MATNRETFPTLLAERFAGTKYTATKSEFYGFLSGWTDSELAGTTVDEVAEMWEQGAGHKSGCSCGSPDCSMRGYLSGNK